MRPDSLIPFPTRCDMVVTYSTPMIGGIVARMLPERARVLDVGCGTGSLARLLVDACHAEVIGIEPVGQYAVRLTFDDGHDTGLYTWKYLRELAEHYQENWARYLKRLDQIGYQRKPLQAAN